MSRDMKVIMESWRGFLLNERKSDKVYLNLINFLIEDYIKDSNVWEMTKVGGPEGKYEWFYGQKFKPQFPPDAVSLRDDRKYWGVPGNVSWLGRIDAAYTYAINSTSWRDKDRKSVV